MARRWLLTAIVTAMLLVAAVFVAHAIRDDDEAAAPVRSAATTAPTSTTTTPTSTSATTVAPSGATTGATTTTAPATATTATTAAPGAAPGPCGAATSPIRTAIDAGVANAPSNADVAACRLAASDPTWAAVQLVARPGAQFTPTTVIVHGTGASWSVVATGGTNAGCGAAPQQVIVDLGQFCTGTGGNAR